jgi:hypothetical protein
MFSILWLSTKSTCIFGECLSLYSNKIDLPYFYLGCSRSVLVLGFFPYFRHRRAKLSKIENQDMKIRERKSRCTIGHTFN